MGIFTKSFWSWEGQKERLANVGQVLAQSLNPFSKLKPQAEVKSKILKAGLEFVAANPYTTAGLITGGVMVAKAPAAALAKVVSVAKAHKVKTAVALIGTGIVVQSKKAREKAIIIAGKATPESLLGAGARIGEFVDEPTGEKFKEALVGGGLIAGAVALGIGAAVIAPKVIPKVAETIKGWRSPEEELIKEKPVGISGEGAILPQTTTITTGKKPYKRRRAIKKPSVKQSIKVNIINKPRATGIRISNRKYLNACLLN